LRRTPLLQRLYFIHQFDIDRRPSIGEGQPVHEDLHRDIVAQLPHLRAFALLLARDRTLANDLVQEAVLRALTHAEQFQRGTNFKAWISAILRNSYFNEVRRRRRASPVDIDTLGNALTVNGGQEEHMQMREFEHAFQTLPDSQREALTLVGASGFSYEEAARISGCAVGTVKSRVSRARLRLQEILERGEPTVSRVSVEVRKAPTHEADQGSATLRR
jgi:RNA polymerase sigma-70 factor, ECF subfamily